jgi:hypothetical protein
MGLVEFYRGTGCDHAGRKLEDIWAFNSEQFEGHDYIQWLFPLTKPSRYQPYIPTLTPSDIETFRAEPELQDRLRHSFVVMLPYYGFEEKEGQITLAKDFSKRAPVWLTPGNHNFERLNRILKSLTLLGVEDKARMLFDALDQLYRRSPLAAMIIGDSHNFWREAVQPSSPPLPSGPSSPDGP